MAGCRDGGHVEQGFPRNVRIFGLQVVETNEDSVIRTNWATRLVATRSVIDGCVPFVSVGGALPRHLLAAAGYNAGGIKGGFTRDIRMSRLQVVKTYKNVPV